MKTIAFKYLTLFFLLFMGITIIAQEQAAIKWYTIEEAVELNKKKKKKFFIDLYTDWCE